MIEEYVGVGPTTSRGAARGPEKAPDSVSPRDARRQLGKTSLMPVRGGEVTADEACTVGKHPQPIPPCREWFALFILCKPGRAGEAENDLADAPSAPRPAPQDVP